MVPGCGQEILAWNEILIFREEYAAQSGIMNPSVSSLKPDRVDVNLRGACCSLSAVLLLVRRAAPFLKLLPALFFSGWVKDVEIICCEKQTLVTLGHAWVTLALVVHPVNV